MTNSDLSLRLILGSARSPRFGDVVERWVVAQIDAMAGLTIETVDPRELALPQDHARDHPSAQRLRTSLHAADAFIVVTPEYNRSYPGALKVLLDSAYDEWQAKPVAFVSYGGISGGLRAVEHLRPVFAELHAMTIRDVVSFANPWNRLDEAGQLRDDPAAVSAFAVMIRRLGWWAHALKHAREANAYVEAA